MKTIRTVIVDDETGCRTALRQLVTKYSEEVEVCGEASDVPSAVRVIGAQKPDLVFLDIEMPKANGFQLFDELPDLQFEVIFTTAYGQHAVKAFRHNAADYLLKPIDPDELNEAVEKVRQKLKQAIEVPTDATSKLAVPTLDGFEFLEIKDIIRCEADRNYTIFHLLGGRTFISSKSLKHYESLLEGSGFFRINRSHLIHLQFILRYGRHKYPTVTTSDGAELIISENRKDKFMASLRGIAKSLE